MFTIPITVGQKVSIARTFSQIEFDRFAQLSGDDNPIHVDPVFAAKTRFGKTVAHGMLLYSVICAAVNNNLPGGSAHQIFQELIFPNPTFTAEQLSIQLQVTDVDLQQGLVTLITQIVKPDRSLGVSGSTQIQLPGFFHQGANHSQLIGDNVIDQEIVHKGLSIGQSASSQRVFYQADLEEYVRLSGDQNPHYQMNPQSDPTEEFQCKVPPGLFGGLISDLLGTKLPGPGTNWLKQKFYYHIPAYAGDEIQGSVEIVRIRSEKDLVNLRTTCFNSKNEIVCDGEALVYVKDLKN